MEEKKYPPNYKLRQARELKGWTQKDVADHIDLPDARTLRRWESGDAVPSLRYRTRLCEVFQMGPVELGFISEPPAPLAAKHEAPAEPVVSVATSAAGSPFTIQTLTSFDKTVSTPNYWNRQHLLRKVYNFWIKDVLEPSLAQNPRLSLVLQEEAGAIANPWRHVVQSSRQASPLFVPGTALLQVYDNACGELMLLGETGSGKTTLLLELARDLLQRAFEQEIHPVPVIFNLTSWPEKRLPIAEWLIEELCSKYQVPRRVGQEWVEHDYILPLIDGFDGVSSPARRECLEQINIYRQLHGLVPFVLCSRKTEYYEQMKPVLLQQAVCIQALTPQQIEGYLLSLGEPMGGLLFAFQDDRDLHQLINTPHMLQILVCAYRDQPVDTLKKLASAELRRAHVLTTYVEYTLNQRNPVPSYSPQQSIRWLTYLARQMKKHCQGEFQLDHLQVDWLSTGWLQRVCSGAFAALRIMLLSGMFLGCMETLLPRVPLGGSGMQLRAEHILLLLLGLLSFWSVSVLGKIVCRVWNKRLVRGPWQRANSSISLALRAGLVVSLLYTALFTLIGPILTYAFPDPSLFAQPVIISGLILALVAGALTGLYKGCEEWIRSRLLRFMLWLGGSIPWNYGYFLDYATQHILLCRVGEGYRFAHHLWFDYFASSVPDRQGQTL